MNNQHLAGIVLLLCSISYNKYGDYKHMTNKEIIKNLQSKSNSIVIDTLQHIEKEGNKDVLIHVIDLLSDTSETIIRDKVIRILENLREQDCTPIVVKAVENPDYKDILSILVSACWKNSLNYSNYVETFTDLFIKADFQLAFDAFTVIDNMETIDLALAESCILRLENAVEDIKDDKKPLYFELIDIISDKRENPA